METTNGHAGYVRPNVQVFPLTMSEPLLIIASKEEMDNNPYGEMENGGFLDE